MTELDIAKGFLGLAGSIAFAYIMISIIFTLMQLWIDVYYDIKKRRGR